MNVHQSVERPRLYRAPCTLTPVWPSYFDSWEQLTGPPTNNKQAERMASTAKKLGRPLSIPEPKIRVLNESDSDKKCDMTSVEVSKELQKLMLRSVSESQSHISFNSVSHFFVLCLSFISVYQLFRFHSLKCLTRLRLTALTLSLWLSQYFSFICHYQPVNVRRIPLISKLACFRCRYHRYRKLGISRWCLCVPNFLHTMMITGRHEGVRYTSLSKMWDSQLVYIIHL